MKVYRKDREYLKNYPDGLVVVCPSTPGFEVENRLYGEKFLLKYGAWGFVKIGRYPDYFSLYLSSPIKKIRFFGVIENIVDPTKEDCRVENYEEYDVYSPEKKVIHLEEPLIELNDEIPFEGRPIPGRRYTTLKEFIEAETTDDLWP